MLIVALYWYCLQGKLNDGHLISLCIHVPILFAGNKWIYYGYIKLADQHLVAMISSVDPAMKCCGNVGYTNVKIVSAPVMFNMTSLITQTLPNYRLYNITHL